MSEQSLPNATISVLKRPVAPIPIRPASSVVAPRNPRPTGLRTLKLDLASTCNIACDYCFVDEGHVLPGPKLMSLPTIERALAWFTAEATSDTCVIVLFGGEPLLNKKGIDYISEKVSFLRHSGRDVRLQIITNATLATQEISQQLAMVDATVMVSIDGNQEVHDTHRVDHAGRPTYARAMRGLKNLQAHLPADRLWARATMSSGIRQIHYFNELFSQGLRNLSLGYVNDSPPDEMSLTQYKIEFDEVISAMVAINKGGRSVRVHPISTYLSLIYGKLGRGERWPQYDCGAATRIVSVTPDGTMYPCEHAVIARSQVDWSIGSVATGIDASRVAEFLAATSRTHTGCATCGSSTMCDLGCRVEYTLANQRSECHAKDAFLFALWERIRYWYEKLAEEDPSILMRMVDERLHSFIRAN